MKHHLLIYSLIILLTPSLSFGQSSNFNARKTQVPDYVSLPQEVLSSLQRKYIGRVIGIHRMKGNAVQVQMITKENKVIFLTLDGRSFKVIQEKKK